MRKYKGLTHMVIRFMDADFQSTQMSMGQDLAGVKHAYERMASAKRVALSWGYTEEEFKTELARLEEFIEEGL